VVPIALSSKARRIQRLDVSAPFALAIRAYDTLLSGEAFQPYWITLKHESNQSTE
jgi:hypothetical protein